METQARIFEKIENSPGFPVMKEDNLELLHIFHNAPSINIDQLIEIVEKNSGLSKTLITSVNSPLLERVNTISSVKEAVMVLGTESVCNIALQRMILEFFPAKRLPGQKFDIAVFWRHLTAAGLLAGKIGRMTHKDDLFKLFSYGILHDIGFIVIDACLPDLMDEIEEKTMNGMHHLVAEKIVLSGLTHNDIGAWICTKWQLGEPLKRIVKYHHFPNQSEVIDDDLRIIYISEVLAGRYYEGVLGSVPQVTTVDEKIVESLGLTMEQLTQLEQELPQRVDKFIQPYLSTYQSGRE